MLVFVSTKNPFFRRQILVVLALVVPQVTGYLLPCWRPRGILQTHSWKLAATEGEWKDEYDGEGEPLEFTAFDEAPSSLQITKQTCITGISPPEPTALNAVVSEIANVTLDEALDLISIGAVWARLQTLREHDFASQYGEGYFTDDDLVDVPQGWFGGNNPPTEELTDEDEGPDLDAFIEGFESQRFRRILKPSVVDPGTDIRVYPNPRRFPACYAMNRTHLLHEDTTFLVVDKPPMLPTQPDASNYMENCPGCTQGLLGPFRDIEDRVIRRPLLCHRVDTVVGGCVVMSKDRNGQRTFQQYQREKNIKKLYLAVTNEPVPIGMHIHWMWSPQTARGKTGGPPCQLVSHEPPESRRKARQFWKRCTLEVSKCVPIEVPKTSFYDPGNRPHYQSTIRLVTGRKHQVRAQLASLGAPIIGDTLYEPIAGLTLGDLDSDDDERLEEGIAKCRAPTAPIGLQAHAILFGGIRVKARAPWWGTTLKR